MVTGATETLAVALTLVRESEMPLETIAMAPFALRAAPLRVVPELSTMLDCAIIVPTCEADRIRAASIITVSTYYSGV